MSDSLQHCLSGAAAAPEPTANCRGAKRPRTVRVVSTSTSDQENEDNTVTGIPRYHTRVVIACKACRARKTKCDSGRPTCTFCTKRNVVCEYDEARVQQSEYVQRFRSSIIGHPRSLECIDLELISSMKMPTLRAPDSRCYH